MGHHIILRFVLFYSLIVIAHLPAAAQRADLLLSRDSVVLSLPEDIRIQSGGEIGNVRLVVWGTTVDQGGNVENALMMNVNGRQALLTSAESRPYGTVAVVPLNDLFLVMWNDRRPSAQGLYGRFVTTGGDMKAEFLLSAGGVLNGVPTLLSFADSNLLLWTDMRNGSPETWGVYILPDGTPFTSVQHFSAGSLDPYRSIRMESGMILLVMNDAPALLLSSNGTLLPRTVPLGRLNTHHFFLNDTTIAVLKNGTFAFYQSVFDDVPLWSIPVPVTDNSRGLVMGREENRFYLAWVALSISNNSPVSWSLTLQRLFVDETDASQWEVVDNSWQSLTQTGSLRNIDVAPTSVVLGCKNSRVITISFKGEYRIAFSQTDFRPFEVGYSYAVDTVGVLHLAKNEGGQYDDGVLFGNCMLARLNIPAIQRVRSDTLSQVVWGATTYSASATYQAAHTPARSPWITTYGDDIAVSWDLPVVGSLVQTRYRSFAESPDRTERVSVPSIARSTSQFWGGSIHGSSTDSVAEAYAGPSEPGYAYRFSYTITLPTSSGWVSRVIRSESGRTVWFSYYPPRIEYLDDGFDPNSGTIAVATFFHKTRGLNLATITSEGLLTTNNSIAWNSGSRGQIVPIDENLFFYITADDTVHRIQVGNSNVETFALQPSKGSVTRCFRLYGSHFLRLTWGNDPGVYYLELYNLNGTLLADRTIQATAIPFILQNPKDFGIVLLWGGNNGVRCTYLDKNLKEVAEKSTGTILTDFRISETHDSVAMPACIFRNGTLFVVWEDFRSGTEPDIYGTGWKVPEKLRAVGEDYITDTVTTPPEVLIPGADLRSHLRILSTAPNPAIGDVAVTVESGVRRIGSVELYDDLGRRVLSQQFTFEEGVHTYRLDLSRVSSGSYQMAAKVGISTQYARLIVWQQ